MWRVMSSNNRPKILPDCKVMHWPWRLKLASEFAQSLTGARSKLFVLFSAVLVLSLR